MPDFKDLVASAPGLKDLSAAAQDELIEVAVMDIASAHRWPFLLQVQQEFTWAANTAIQSFSDLFRIWSIMFPDTATNYYRLQELSDIEFQRWIEQYPDDVETRVWRDAGVVGNKQSIEFYAVPTSAKTIKIDYTQLPGGSSIEDLPARFKNLVLHNMMATVGTYSQFGYTMDLQRAIAREKDLQGKRGVVGRDEIQSSRMRNINNPL
jgi:hypothetical protein